MLPAMWLTRLLEIALFLGFVPLWAPRAVLPDDSRVRRALPLVLGFIVALRLACEGLRIAPTGPLVVVASVVGQVAAVLLLATIARLALTAPWRRGAIRVRFGLLVIGSVLLWQREAKGAVVLFSLAFLRAPWLTVLRTGERFRVVLVGLLALVALFVGMPDLGPIVERLGAGGELIRVARNVALVVGVHAVLAGFEAFTRDPSLGIRRVSLRLTLSHVLVVTVPLLIVFTLWVSSAYLGVNADRALMAGRPTASRNTNCKAINS